MESFNSKKALTSQEIRVSVLLTKEYEPEEIAKIMQVSLHTVKSLIYKIKRMTLK